MIIIKIIVAIIFFLPCVIALLVGIALLIAMWDDNIK